MFQEAFQTCLVMKAALFLIVDMKVCCNANNQKRNQLLHIDKSYCFSGTVVEDLWNFIPFG